MGCEQEELGLEGTEEEAAQIAKMQAAHRGKQDRQRVAEMKGKKIEVPQLMPEHTLPFCTNLESRSQSDLQKELT